MKRLKRVKKEATMRVQPFARFTSGTVLGMSFALLLAPVTPVLAQTGKVTGVVTDQSTGQPLSGVQVFLEGTGRGVLAQENGRYFLINIPPGTYTAVAELVGYASVRKQGVLVSIDVTRTVDFELPLQAVAVREVVVEAERVPLVELSTTGSGTQLSLEDISALPVDDITGALELQSGFLHVPQNTDVIAFAEERRGVTPLRIRGGRGAETLTLVDGVPVNNFVLGGPAVNLTRMAVGQIDFVKGGFEPQYGNALSGFINIATREPTDDLEGSIEYRSTRLGAALGNGYDEAGNSDIFEGFISGPVPLLGDRLRFLFAGRHGYGPDRVLEFDDEVYRPTQVGSQRNPPHALDVIPGWRAVGFDAQRDAFSKLVYYVTPAAKLSASWLTYQRQSKTFDFRWMFAGVDPLADQLTEADSAFYGTAESRNRLTQFLQQNSYFQKRNLYVLRWDHTLGRTAYQLTAGRFDQFRETCNVAQGVCLGNEFEDPNFDGAGYVRDGSDFTRTPTTGTDRFWGGEDITTSVARADLQSQLTDHHNFRLGVFYQNHEVTYDEWECGCVNQANKIQNFWKAEPWDFAAFIQDQIEYDFITINLGFRFDHGEANGTFLANPLDPTNGTTALEVCANPSAFGQSGTLECADLEDRAVATELAARDDFAEAEARSQFSPRIGVNIPVTESASLFFNFGRFSQNPLLKNLFQWTKVGTAEEGTAKALTLEEFEGRQPFLGNPKLKIEQTTSYEVGYVQEIGNVYALSVVAFTKDQFGLTGVRTVGLPPFTTFDPGATYGTNNPRYLILVNGDFSTTRGFEIGLRRRLTDFWGFDLNYAYTRATTNAADPERERERVDFENDPQLLKEIRSEIDQPHVFNGTIRFAAREEAPRLGAFGEALRHTRASLTLQAASGLPYTPILDFFGGEEADRLERNSGRQPSTLIVNLRVEKDVFWSNLRYGVFVDVRNLLDNKYCLQVFETTGDCRGGTEDQSRRRVSNGFSDQAPSTVWDRPNFFGERRSIQAGVRVNF
ncbi:MAG: TonB-dependent receptor [Gemmatimonadetes bacterium]|nr:TonB-dependent receptor [Gemmatimonadota bacterium]